MFGEIDKEEAIAAVHEAFKLGINFFDTSPYYGDTESEKVLGEALQRLPRTEIVIATKVGQYGNKEFDYSADRVTLSVHESLHRLQTSYIDLIQCHDMEFVDLDQVVNETLPALHRLKESGLVRHVGITGLPLKIFTTVLDKAPPGLVDTVLSYCHYCLNDTSLEDIMDYLEGKQVGVINASPLSMGLLSPLGPAHWHPAPAQLRDLCGQSVQHAAERGTSLPRLALKFAVRNPRIATTLVGMSTRQQVTTNADAVMAALGVIPDPQAQLEDQVTSEVEAILAPVKNLTWPSGRPENN